MTFLYEAETSTVYSNLVKKLNHFHLSRLRGILKLRGQGRTPDTEFLERIGILSSPAILRKLQLRYNGHFMRMEDTRLPKKLFFVYIAMGTSRQGGKKRLYMDTLKDFLKRLQIHSETCNDLPQNRPTWRREERRPAQIGSPTPEPKGDSEVTITSPLQCEPFAAPNMSGMPTSIPRANRFHGTASGPVRRQPDNVYFFSHSHSCRKPPRRFLPLSPSITMLLPCCHRPLTSPALPQPLHQPQRPASPPPHIHALPHQRDDACHLIIFYHHH
nr:unnamed protein product [Spirometra erinaceieuropaei]